MSWWNKIFENRPAIAAPTAAACLTGVLCLFSRLGDPLARLSYDVPFLFAPNAATNDVVVITMDESTYSDPELNGTNRYPTFDWATHARLLDKLKKDGAPLVVFDIFFGSLNPGAAAFAAAITNHGNVILAAQSERINEVLFPGPQISPPHPALRDLPGSRLALPEVSKDTDDAVRTFPKESEMMPSIPFAAAQAVGRNPPASGRPRGIAYYAPGSLVIGAYKSAFTRRDGYFRDKVVFIGGKPRIDFLLESSDEFRTPLTRWSGQLMRGVELHATMFLNLTQHQCLERLSGGKEFLLILGAGIAFGCAAAAFRPWPGLGFWLITAAGLAVVAIALFWLERIWFNWIIVAAVQLPVAWLVSALTHSSRELAETKRLTKELETRKSGSLLPTVRERPVVNLTGFDRGEQPRTDAEVTIRDYELLRMIGEGAYGQVWFARAITGVYRAVKIVFRRNFTEQRPFEREFEGVQNFQRISYTHPGWVQIYHVGKDEAAGFFHYVMEPADDLMWGTKIDPASYVPKTLGKLLVEHPWLPVRECVKIGIQLSAALEALHRLNLIHRDVKPSNVIFVDNAAKLADIGLVARMNESKSIVGTEGFIPEEGLGTPGADIFSLGRLLYQAATGNPPNAHPDLPKSLNERTDAEELLLLINPIINKAAALRSVDRYPSAMALHEDLVELQRRLG